MVHTLMYACECCLVTLKQNFIDIIFELLLNMAESLVSPGVVICNCQHIYILHRLHFLKRLGESLPPCIDTND